MVAGQFCAHLPGYCVFPECSLSGSTLVVTGSVDRLCPSCSSPSKKELFPIPVKKQV